MKYTTRVIEKQIQLASEGFPALVVTGPRRAGKTCMLRHLFPEADYYLLEEPDLVGRIRNDPQGFLDGIRLPVLLDEIQAVPELLAYIRARIDRMPGTQGQWLITGSQESALMQGVTESMAGRAAIFQLHPMSSIEDPHVNVLNGGYPEVLARPKQAQLWFSSYLQTYLERDVRSITAVKDLATFRRLLALVATRHGQMLNKTDLASPLGVSVPTVTQWLGILEITEQILIVPPFFENAGKRLVKSPKVYIADSGLACHLLGIQTADELAKSPFAGVLFEGFVASEIVKAQVNAGKRRECYYFRDEQGLEVDFLVPLPSGGILLAECKSGATCTPKMVSPMLRLAKAIGKRRPEGTHINMQLIFDPADYKDSINAISPGVKATPWRQFVDQINKW